MHTYIILLGGLKMLRDFFLFFLSLSLRFSRRLLFPHYHSPVSPRPPVVLAERFYCRKKNSQRSLYKAAHRNSERNVTACRRGVGYAANALLTKITIIALVYVAKKSTTRTTLHSIHF